MLYYVLLYQDSLLNNMKNIGELMTVTIYIYNESRGLPLGL